MDWRCLCTLCLFFFFQAEDGIRDLIVTGVQTCALPISSAASSPSDAGAGGAGLADSGRARAPSASSGDRKSGVEGKSVDLGGRRIIKKKKKRKRGRRGRVSQQR